MPNTDREAALLAAVLEKPTRAERAAYLEGACGGDHAMRARIEALLAAQEASGGVPNALPTALAATRAYRPLTEGAGTIIGPYKLLQQIGEGGMGVVYMAEQQEPIRRKVALKIIKPGLDSHQVIARFEAERQALALMDHQNIARVLDAGTTASGRPYFVMELVHGVPITRFCDDNKLTPRERLALFVPVCQAIQHAHQKGIIHRDVKPSNVLVTMYDDKPVPKVIDFGVAKAIEQRLTEKTIVTQFGALVGTFAYMSPEQAEMNAFGVDTRSDIYSLGVLLYELLTGTTPLESKRLREVALDEMVRLIREEEAPRPSKRLSSSDNLPRIAAARRTEPARLSKLVRGEIDWIVMKCLEKDRSRRYDTASGLARDLERYLADEPVEACPPSARYRLSKFARKYKKALVTAAAFAVILVAGVVLSTLLAVWATSAEREANRQRIASDDAKREALEAKTEADKQRDEARITAYASGMGLAQRAWAENNVVRARELLEEVPKEVAGRDLRGFEWYYLNRLCHSEALTLKGHSSAVWSPDGQRLASWGDANSMHSSASKTVKIWDSVTGKELFALKGHTGGVTSVAFSPDGQRLASGSDDKTVKIWDSATGKELFSLKHAGSISSVAFSPDGRRLASESSVGTVETVGTTTFSNTVSTVKIWDSVTGKEVFSVKGLTGLAGKVAFSPDGQRLASGSYVGTVKIWDSATGKELFSLQDPRRLSSSVAFSPDGQRLAWGSLNKTVKIWDSVTGKELFALKGHTGGVTSVAFSPDGQRLASGSDDQTVKIWDSATGTELFSLKHAGSAQSVAFSPDGQRLASGSGDKTVRIWDSATGTELAFLKGHAGGVTSVAFSPDGQRLASGSYDDTVKIWDRDTGKDLFSPKDLWVESVAFSPDSQRLALASHKTVKIWDCATGNMSSLNGHTSSVRSVAFSPDGQRLASGSADSIVKIWDSATGKELLTLKGHADSVMSVAFSPDGQRLASGSCVRTWVETGARRTLVKTVGMVKIWDSVSGKELLSIKGHTEAVMSVAFSPNGQRLASGGGDKTVKIWDTVTGKELFALKGHTRSVTSVAFSPDGKRIVSGSGDQTVKVWDAQTGKELFALKGHAGGVRSVAFSPDGQRLASGSDDQTVKIWDSATGTELASLKSQAGFVNSVTFSLDGQCLASVEGGFFVIRETAVSPEMQQRREANMQTRLEANRLVADLFKQLGLRDAVLERLRTAHGLSPAVRREALAAAQTYPENPSALYNLGVVLRDMGNLDGAAACFRKAIELDPKYARACERLGLTLYRQGDLEGAIVVFKAAIRVDPKDFWAHYNLGLALQAKKDVEGAIAAFKQSIRVNPKNAIAHTGLGAALLDKKDVEGAIAAFKEAIRLDPKLAWAHDNLRRAELLPHLADVLAGKQKPKSPAEACELARLCAQPFEKRYAAAVRLFEDAFAADPKLADDLKAWNRYNAACCAALAAAGLGKDDPPPDQAQKAALRRQALAWLRADLDLRAKQLSNDKPEDRKTVGATLRHWRQDSDLAGLRDAAKLAKLPADEQKACRKLWADVQALLDKANAKK